jgi:hypothetical protein
MSDVASILNRHTRQREYFDPANKRHLAELKYFIEHKRWQGTCPFYQEFPHLDIPTLCANRYLAYSLK